MINYNDIRMDWRVNSNNVISYVLKIIKIQSFRRSTVGIKNIQIEICNVLGIFFFFFI